MVSTTTLDDEITRERIVDPFFKKAIDNVFIHSDKSLFVMDGPMGTGKTSEFSIRGPYLIGCGVRPIKKGNRLVRESKWAVIRESEMSAYNTIVAFLQEAIFSPAILAENDTLITTADNHPKRVKVRHDLPDGTEVEMIFECHGFNNEKAHNRLRTHEFLGAIIPEIQGIPWNIVTTAISRCGRWRADDLLIDREIDGKIYTLSGAKKLKMVFADVNIPARPHPLYDHWYDANNKEQLPYYFQRPPQPILPIPVEKVKDKKPELLEKYPVTIYQEKEVVWIPNPKAYNFTRHFEEKEEIEVDGKTVVRRIPWSGYGYWLNMVFDSESEVTRFVLGKPDSRAGVGAIYKKFRKTKESVCKRELDRIRPVYAGFDPGGHAGIILMQKHENNHVHFFKEFVFSLEDNTSTREQINDFLFKYCKENLGGMHIVIVPDPAAAWLGKSKMLGSTESAMQVLAMSVRQANADPAYTCEFSIQPPKVLNQETDVRINSLKYFIEQRKISVDPAGCEIFLLGLCGNYARKVTRQGAVSDEIDKTAESCDIVEAAQYPCITFLQQINMDRELQRSKNKSAPKQASIKRRRG